MAYQSYLVERFETTHENLFFRELNELLLNHYSDKNGLHILIGNLSVGGHKLDAIFIRSGAIIVIDFKDYEGTLTFSENGPWHLKSKEGKMLFVAGGAASRNPYQQVNAYRFSLFQMLSDNTTSILDSNNTKVKWDHTNAMVLFHNSILFDKESVPKKISRFFHVTDKNHFIHTLDAIVSNYLIFEDKEITAILKMLNISSDSIFDKNEITEEEDKLIINNTQSLVYKLDRIIPSKHSDSALNNLAFYRTLLSIERFNEVEVSDISHVQFDWARVEEGTYHLNLSLFKNFYDRFEKNRVGNFPKHLFVSINVSMNDLVIPLLYTTITNTEIVSLLDVFVNFNSFELFTAVLTELQLPENVIEELNAAVSNENSFEAKIAAISKILDMSLALQGFISLGLSNEAIYSAQLQSEIDSLLKGRVQAPAEGTVLRGFLDVNNHINTLPAASMKYIYVNELNPSQQVAVKLSFEQPLSIITGPPGTGKSQVVMNIMANAVYNNQKVLFASKNNKAVDNVYKRLNSLLDTDYFIRLGNNEENKRTEDILTKFANETDQNKLVELNEKLKSSSNKIAEITARLTFIEDKLNRIPLLTNRITVLKVQVDQATLQYESWKGTVDSKQYQLYIQEKLTYNFPISELNNAVNKITAANGVLANLIYNLFHKSKISAFVKSINQQLPQKLQDHINASHPSIKIGVNAKESMKQNLLFIATENKLQKEVFEKDREFTANLSKLNKVITQTEEELKTLISQERQFKAENADLQQQKIAQSKVALLDTIAVKKASATSYKINAYKSYLSNGLPWKTDEQSVASSICADFSNHFQAISISNLTIKKAFLLEPEIFDLLIIDEASQSDIASVLPLIYRAKRVCILGDPLQLTHITSVKKEEQKYVAEKLNVVLLQHNYIQNSLFLHAEQVANKNEFQQVFLNEHYRCHPEIIGFSNEYFYRQLAGQEMEIRTDARNFHIADIGFNWIDVQGIVSEKGNVNMAEVNKTLELVLDLRKKYPKASIGITTPFRNQKEQLIKAVQPHPNLNVTVDTVHRFQGDEKDIMIFSLVCSTKGRESMNNFINTHAKNLINVGITRAKSALYIVGNKQYCSEIVSNNQKSLLAKLANYTTLLNK